MSTDKNKPEGARPKKAASNMDKDLRTALEIHTLAQQIYSHLATTRTFAQPWGTPFVGGPAEPACCGWPPDPGAQPSPTWGPPPSWTW